MSRGFYAMGHEKISEIILDCHSNLENHGAETISFTVFGILSVKLLVWHGKYG